MYPLQDTAKRGLTATRGSFRRTGESLHDKISVWKWGADDIRNLHLQLHSRGQEDTPLICEHISTQGGLIDREQIEIPGKAEIRFTVGQEANDEKEIRVMYARAVTCRIAGLEDRAHFP